MVVLKDQTRPRRFAVVGAGGAAGLATLKALEDELHDHVQAGDCEIVGFEQRHDIGGIWLPEPRPNPSEKKWPDSPVYDSLMTNIPHPIMCYSSHLAAPSTPLITTTQTIKDYMQSYIDRFNIRQYIRLNSRVTAATWDSSINQWRVAYQSVGSDVNGSPIESISYFDHLIVANGHFSHPFIPDIDGLKAWASSGCRSYIHSTWYRNSELYHDRNVLVVGAGRSGMDISREVSLVSKKMVHSARSFGDQEFERIIQRGDISHLSSDGFVHFKNGQYEYVDRIVFATGYKFDHSFLTQLPVHEPQATSDHLYSSGFHIYPLALHTFPLQAAFPPNSLAFIGVPVGVSFTLFEVQATLAVRQMTGQISLDFDYELSQTIQRNNELRQKYTSPLEVARRMHRFDLATAYDFVDFLAEKADDPRRIPEWKRKLMPESQLVRAEWLDLERLGLANSWVRGVGEGGIQEWIDLMWKVVNRARERKRQDTTILI